VVTAWLLQHAFPDAFFVMDRVERYVLRASDQDILGFLHSYSSSFNMVGVVVSTGPSLKTVSSYLDRS